MNVLLAYTGLGSFAAVGVGVAFAHQELTVGGCAGVGACWVVELGRSYLRAKRAAADLRGDTQRRAGRAA